MYILSALRTTSTKYPKRCSTLESKHHFMQSISIHHFGRLSIPLAKQTTHTSTAFSFQLSLSLSRHFGYSSRLPLPLSLFN